MTALEAREFLEQIKKLDTMIENKEIERQQWLDIAENTTNGGKSVLVRLPNGTLELQNMEKVQSSGSLDPMGNAICNAVDIEAEYEAAKLELQTQKEKIIKVIEQLPTDEYTVLHLVYVQGFTLKMAAYEKRRGYNWAKKAHRRGLAGVQRILDEREDLWQEKK